MLGYYGGRLLQLVGLAITGETLIVYFGQMEPLLRGSVIGVAVFSLGYFMVRKFGVKS